LLLLSSLKKIDSTIKITNTDTTPHCSNHFSSKLCSERIVILPILFLCDSKSRNCLFCLKESPLSCGAIMVFLPHTAPPLFASPSAPRCCRFWQIPRRICFLRRIGLSKHWLTRVQSDAPLPFPRLTRAVKRASATENSSRSSEEVSDPDSDAISFNLDFGPTVLGVC
jgi:hypothetical protein